MGCGRGADRILWCKNIALLIPGILALPWLLDGAPPQTAQEGEPALSIRFEGPAERWTEALPVGNGRLGAMVFGGFPLERIQLNEDTICAGGPVPELAEDAGEKIAAARKLFFEGRPAAGQALVQQAMAR